MNFDSSPVEGNFLFSCISSFWPVGWECPFECPDYSRVKKPCLNSAVLVWSGKKECCFGTSAVSLECINSKHLISNVSFSMCCLFCNSCSIVFDTIPLCFSGEQLLMAGEVFTIRPLQLYAVTQQLLQGKPTCANGDAKTDLGHILDFTCRLKYLKVSYPCRSTGYISTRLTLFLAFFWSLVWMRKTFGESKHLQVLGSQC